MKRTRWLAAVSAALVATVGCGRGDAPQIEGNPVTAPDIQTRTIDYQVGDTRLVGFVAWDAAVTGKRPGVLVVHEWWGHNEHARNQAKRLAEAGYVGLALDLYGDGKVTSHPDSAGAFVAEAMKDPEVLFARFNAALEQLKQDPNVDPEQIAAIGYCFGGAVVLSAARMGIDLDAVVSFHGALRPLPPADPGKVKARVLVLTGGADPMVPSDHVESFRKEMEAAGARFEIITYPNAKHSFTNPNADHVGMEALQYDAEVDQQSWNELLKLFSEVFPRR